MKIGSITIKNKESEKSEKGRTEKSFRINATLMNLCIRNYKIKKNLFVLHNYTLFVNQYILTHVD